MKKMTKAEKEKLERIEKTEKILNAFWLSLPEKVKYKDFNKEFAVLEPNSVKKLLAVEKKHDKLHLSSKTNDNKVVFSFLTLIATITDTLIDYPLAALINTNDIKDETVIIGWKFIGYDEDLEKK